MSSASDDRFLQCTFNSEVCPVNVSDRRLSTGVNTCSSSNFLLPPNICIHMLPGRADQYHSGTMLGTVARSRTHETYSINIRDLLIFEIFEPASLPLSNLASRCSSTRSRYPGGRSPRNCLVEFSALTPALGSVIERHSAFLSCERLGEHGSAPPLACCDASIVPWWSSWALPERRRMLAELRRIDLADLERPVTIRCWSQRAARPPCWSPGRHRSLS